MDRRFFLKGLMFVLPALIILPAKKEPPLKDISWEAAGQGNGEIIGSVLYDGETGAILSMEEFVNVK